MRNTLMHFITQEKLDKLADICVRLNVRKLALFGSATGDNFKPDSSDMDFVVEFDSMQPSEHADCYFGLLEDLENLFGTSIDLVEASTIKNPYFRESVEESLIKIYAAA
jgi:predicted nucleotidyltransferase